MTLKQSPLKTMEFLNNPQSWPQFLSFYYWINEQLNLRNINGSEVVSFKSELNEHVLTIFIYNDKKQFKYEFEILPDTNNNQWTDIKLRTNYTIPYIQNKALYIMGINITQSQEQILDNLSHFVDFGHIH